MPAVYSLAKDIEQTKPEQNMAGESKMFDNIIVGGVFQHYESS